MTSREFPEVESIAGAPSVLTSPFAAMHGLPSPLTGPYNGVAPAGGLAGLGGFTLGAGALGVRVPGSPQPSSVLLISNLNEEVSAPMTHPAFYHHSFDSEHLFESGTFSFTNSRFNFDMISPRGTTIQKIF